MLIPSIWRRRSVNLTVLAKTLLQAVDALVHWALDHHEEVSEALRAHDARAAEVDAS